MTTVSKEELYILQDISFSRDIVPDFYVDISKLEDGDGHDGIAFQLFCLKIDNKLEG